MRVVIGKFGKKVSKLIRYTIPIMAKTIIVVMLPNRLCIDGEQSTVFSETVFLFKSNVPLGLIMIYIIGNLFIEKDHFTTIPFSDMGGWKKAKDVFGDKLETVIAELNEEMIK